MDHVLDWPGEARVTQYDESALMNGIRALTELHATLRQHVNASEGRDSFTLRGVPEHGDSAADSARRIAVGLLDARRQSVVKSLSLRLPPWILLLLTWPGLLLMGLPLFSWQSAVLVVVGVTGANWAMTYVGRVNRAGADLVKCLAASQDLRELFDPYGRRGLPSMPLAFEPPSSSE